MTNCNTKVKPWPHRSIVKNITLKSLSKELGESLGHLGRALNSVQRELMLRLRNLFIKS